MHTINRQLTEQIKTLTSLMQLLAAATDRVPAECIHQLMVMPVTQLQAAQEALDRRCRERQHSGGVSTLN